ncbi:uncharacterized protein LOC130050170 [Ostrea edulis]|uniref:uncharacterized protein LOC130050170 n=1 Tax=Ostrea edulis TaxID=37623 RepID=UPI0024AF8D33|nr:uncharacterized protein LOC130050170 [Ostrea edulis]
MELRNKFSVLNDEQEMSIHDFNKTVYEVGDKILGPKRKKSEEWISKNTWKVIDERKDVKKRLIQTKSERIKDQLENRYRSLDKEVKKSTKRDKQAYIENLADEAEMAAASQDLGKLYRITKMLTGRFTNCETAVKNELGQIIAGDEEKLKRWKDHFENVLNKGSPAVAAIIQPATEFLDINIESPIQEVQAAIKALKNGKAPGQDGIQAELLKCEANILPSTLTCILENIWITEETPDDWKMGLITKLPKKGDLFDCNNWRGIMLLSVTSKVLSRNVFNRITREVDTCLRKNQAGFRKRKSCSDQIFSLRQIIEQSNE